MQLSMEGEWAVKEIVKKKYAQRPVPLSPKRPPNRVYIHDDFEPLGVFMQDGVGHYEGPYSIRLPVV
ncbi:hypothetical protein [Spirosoma sp. KNUC1025]|uniref:hypothetical protein n=1 Tax=Spirosoma sp. KNUC1025 TaxID=2894082 RepID=UPI001E3473C2|nr:hypothetical protein [Spirosoma sp. KNUC1025]UFH57734.1 hypothetical protein LN737_32430 [Spirosoma sp. KNUC1025]